MIGSHVEIGALSTVLSGTIMPTIVEDYVKIDDHVHVGHNVRVARGASVTAGVVIGGSAIIEGGSMGRDELQYSRRAACRFLRAGRDGRINSGGSLAANSIARAPRADVKERPDDDRSVIGFP